MDPKTLDMQYLDENGNAVAKESLSAGEKQLMVIAILWALAICSKKKLPVIIDTPLSRLDSQHRISIISTYFPMLVIKPLFSLQIQKLIIIIMT